MNFFSCVEIDARSFDVGLKLTAFRQPNLNVGPNNVEAVYQACLIPPWVLERLATIRQLGAEPPQEGAERTIFDAERFCEVSCA